MESATDLRVRRAADGDRQAITRLLRRAPHTHYHVDWHLPADWLGSPGFVVGERPFPPDDRPLVIACLAATADPPPAAWVRVAAVDAGERPAAALAALLTPVLAALRDQAVREVAWLASLPWLVDHLPALGFAEIDAIATYVKPDLQAPAAPAPAPVASLRAATALDMPRLAAIEAAAYDPLWRHSEGALRLALSGAVAFDVAEVDGQVVGFQYSSAGQGGMAHLARLSVDPAFHRRGIGSALLRRALAAYGRLGFRQVSLNTQLSNRPSQALYERFGFTLSGAPVPIWSRAP